MNGFTPAQVKAIAGWTEQRDALLRDIGLLSPELEAKQKASIEAGQNLAALHVQIGEAKGRLSEIQALEERHKTSVSIEVSELEARKSRLEAECIAQEDELNASKREQGIVISATAALAHGNDTMKDQATIVEKVVGQVIETSKNAISDIKTKTDEVRAVALEVIDKGNENVKQTNIVLEKMPKFIFNLQRPIPVRRTYPPGHPNAPVSAPEIPIEAVQVN